MRKTTAKERTAPKAKAEAKATATPKSRSRKPVSAFAHFDG